MEPVYITSSITVRPFEVKDALGVSQLMRVVYAEDYPAKIYYDPEKLIEANLSQKIISTVACSEDGQIVSHVAFFYPMPNKSVVEWGAGLVHPSFRGEKIYSTMLDYSLRSYLEIYGQNTSVIFGEEVCSSPKSQVYPRRHGLVPMALEVDLLPHMLHDSGQTEEKRVSTILSFLGVRMELQEVFIPQIYQQEAQTLYSDFHGQRKMIWSGDDGIAVGESDFLIEKFLPIQMVRVTVRNVGSNFREAILELENTIKAEGVEVISCWLSLDRKETSLAVSILRDLGYFFGGFMPYWLSVDAILIQKCFHRPNWEGIQLFGEQGETLFQLVQADWKKSISS